MLVSPHFLSSKLIYCIMIHKELAEFLLFRKISRASHCLQLTIVTLLTTVSFSVLLHCTSIFSSSLGVSILGRATSSVPMCNP